ncbi:AMP-dependent synthetase [Salimicrobium jeotgali]|uniref:acetate--CoA ligase n=2 Tax=Salimicrobium TaxID=351195 RepID=K2G888_9BACI|nr:AMP-binding protein [Salimicrobium salexigens]AKG04846.1 AMP-dependent synthetase [Salimicrobium jeotgali]EKE30592.1 acetoacetyl-CoA synthase [Salimicrobium jeotgali]MBM7696826.1 acetyl-CoA synthetase [Salimicrobium jeotgali]SIS46405.1 acetyl-CoA synthetase [Salimicrobium salexigens]
MTTYEDVWIPSEEKMKQTRLYQWMKRLGYEDYKQFHQATVSDISWFWDEAVKEIDFEWFDSYQKTLDLSRGAPHPDWFRGGTTNATLNALDKWTKDEDKKNDIALYWEGDNGDRVKYTFTELDEEVNAVAAGLKKLGITEGDIITIYLPMLPETLISMLAISKIGAIFSPAFSGYKADAVKTRVNACEAKAIITADGFFRRGKTVNMKEEADKAAEVCDSLEHVIVVERAGVSFEKKPKDVLFNEMKEPNASVETMEKHADDPFMLIYTSGTTGTPKGAVHTHAGFPVKSAFDAGMCMDVGKDDTLFWFTDMGWMMGPFLVYGGLVNGASIVMFEGTPDYPEPDRLWELVERYKVTHLGISPTLVRGMMKHGESWIDRHDLSSLEVIGSTGEPWNPEPWHWLYKHVGKERVPIFNYSGGTETSGGMVGNVLVKPIQPVTFNAALPGMDVDVLDDEGRPVVNDVGELVLKQPWVGMTKSFYKDDDRYHRTYWNRFKDIWVHGDWATVDERGYFLISGRSDDVLNVAGKRIGPSEIESAIVEHEEVIEAGVIGAPHDMKGEEPVAFVVTKTENSETLLEELQQLLTDKLGKAIAPKKIYIVSDLPKTRNAKVMRRAIKSAFLNRNQGDLSALENPETVEEIKKIGASVH